MAVAVPSHTIRTIHGSFGIPSFSSVASGISAAQASSFASLPNITYPPSQSRAESLSILANRTSAPRSAPAPPVYHRTTSFNRPRSTTIVSAQPVVTRRPAPPPPPPALQVIHIPEVEDPFMDSPSHSEPVVVSLPPPRRASRTTQSRHGSWMPAQPSPPADRRAAKLVASVLLSRGCGRPMRRRPAFGENKTYVKSGLSRMVEVDC
ncbi:hypothetical protein BXZ70DRAFT_1008389 [Cristinia sonorae]|uniref:Uncharacterized protein n=1 Tax=Cristinia sonorae TaxID=1940300 RepID=A0A8K0UPC6_9AGAR|nr:hypothetical protein BXZ70DRAFT_1008389 [Cristinia sonorae]